MNRFKSRDRQRNQTQMLEKKCSSLILREKVPAISYFHDIAGVLPQNSVGEASTSSARPEALREPCDDRKGKRSPCVSDRHSEHASARDRGLGVFKVYSTAFPSFCPFAAKHKSFARQHVWYAGRQ